MIPKVIHYIWFGRGEKDDRTKHCIETWKKIMPDYEIKEWNEDNFDINYNDFTKQAYKCKAYAYVSDVARLWVLYNYGGIYMDTDVEVYKPLDEFLDQEAFSGFENVHYPITATLGSVKGNPVIKLLLDYYDCRDFTKYDNWEDYVINQETNTCIISNLLSSLGIDRERDEEQHIKHFSVYPRSYFFTKDEGYTWHSFNGSWTQPHKFSVIIPCYHESEEDFRRCLDSIKNQTLQPYEVICVDDYSPSDIPKIAIEYGFKYIRHTENKNNGGARNTGIRSATGDYLVFVNADDYLVPEALEEIDKVAGGQDLILIGFKSFGTQEFGYIPDQKTVPYLTKLGWNGEPMHVVNRQFILDNDLFELENVAFCDVDWSTRVENKADSYTFVPKALYMFQTGNPNSTTTKILNGTYEGQIL